ncbi:uncharacterized protein SCHCODRAFT_02565082 [Schizophyllum commune H4-8]|nr:uncharacterized protein SCHCODRAFT_02565082 [Schizophyllum commune H4-8]KAI5897804.1 hypothetical protein SCHCODRAFT_02565082 [Schizophyllum commune H4-8]
MKSPQLAAQSLRARLLRYHQLPTYAVNELADAYLSTVSQLCDTLMDYCALLDEDDPGRLELVAYYDSQLDALADEAVGKVEHWSESEVPISSGKDALDNRNHPVLEEYLKHNAYPSPIDKQRLAEQEGMSYRQVHVWFQNRRARAKEHGRSSTALSHARRRRTCMGSKGYAWPARMLPRSASHVNSLSEDEPVPQKPSGHAPARSPEKRRFARHPLPYVAVQTKQRRRSRGVTQVDDLVPVFDNMNVRSAVVDPATTCQGYAACRAFTYVPPKAPLPSYVPPPGRSDPPAPSQPCPTTLGSSPQVCAGKFPAPSTRESRRSQALRAVNSADSRGDRLHRLPSLTFSDSSSSSSSPPSSPELGTFEDLPSAAPMDNLYQITMQSSAPPLSSALPGSFVPSWDPALDCGRGAPCFQDGLCRTESDEHDSRYSTITSQDPSLVANAAAASVGSCVPSPPFSQAEGQAMPHIFEGRSTTPAQALFGAENTALSDLSLSFYDFYSYGRSVVQAGVRHGKVLSQATATTPTAPAVASIAYWSSMLLPHPAGLQSSSASTIHGYLSCRRIENAGLWHVRCYVWTQACSHVSVIRPGWLLFFPLTLRSASDNAPVGASLVNHIFDFPLSIR